MPTNAEIHVAIDRYITAQRSHILNNTVAQIFHDMVDNIGLGGGGLTIETSATFAAIDAGTEQRLVIVTADETNNGDKSLYIHDGTTLLFLQTIG